MPSFFVHFIAHIDERKRPEGFPKEVYVDDTYGVENNEQLGKIVNRRFVELVSSSGLVVMKKYDETIDQSILSFDKRIFVPWHMITHLEVSVRQLVEPPPPTSQDALIPEPEDESEPKPTVN